MVNPNKAKKTELDSFYLVRPLFNDMKVDQYGIPIIHALHEKDVDIENLLPMNFQNLRKGKTYHNRLVLNFSYDSKLDKQWNNTMNYIPMLTGCGAVCTLDYSISPKMPRPWFTQYIFRSRYTGCLWQHYKINVIPSIPWCYPDTYDICFSSIEPGGIVIVSSLGAHNHPKIFLDGFNAMKYTLSPSLIIVYGDIIKGMSGRFMHISYKEAFEKKQNPIEQIPLFTMRRIFTKEAN